MKSLTDLFNPPPKKSGITKRRENIEDIFSTSIYSKDLVKNIYNCVYKIVVDHDKAKEETRAIFNRISKN